MKMTRQRQRVRLSASRSIAAGKCGVSAKRPLDQIGSLCFARASTQIINNLGVHLQEEISSQAPKTVETVEVAPATQQCRQNRKRAPGGTRLLNVYGADDRN